MFSNLLHENQFQIGIDFFLYLSILSLTFKVLMAFFFVQFYSESYLRSKRMLLTDDDGTTSSLELERSSPSPMVCLTNF